MIKKPIITIIALMLSASSARAFDLGDHREYDFTLDGPELTDLGFDCVYGGIPVCTLEFPDGKVLFGLPMKEVTARIDTVDEDVQVYEFTPKKSPSSLERSIETLSQHFGVPLKYKEARGIHHIWLFENGTSAVTDLTYDGEEFEGLRLYDDDHTDYLIKTENLPRP